MEAGAGAGKSPLKNVSQEPGAKPFLKEAGAVEKDTGSPTLVFTVEKEGISKKDNDIVNNISLIW